MKKKALTLAIFAALGMGVAAATMEMMSELGVAEQVEERAPAISFDGSTVSVSGASGMLLEVVSLTGRAVAQYKIESAVQRVELNLPKGCYILKVGKVVRKITVR